MNRICRTLNPPSPQPSPPPAPDKSAENAKRFLKRLGVHFKRHRRVIGFALLCMLLHSACRQAPIVAAGLLANNVLLEDTFTHAERLKWLWIIAGGILVAAAFGSVFFYICENFFKWLATRVVVEIRAEVMQHLLRLPARYFHKRKMGDLHSRLTNDVQATFQTVNLFMSELVMEPIAIVSGFIPAFAASWQLSLLMIPVVPLVVIPVLKQGKKVRRRSRKGFEALGETTEVMMQSLAGIRTVKAFQAEEGEYQRFRRYNEEFLERNLKLVSTKAASRAAMDFLYAAAVAVFILIAGLLLLNQAWGLDKPGDLIMFMGAMGAMFRPVRRLAQAYSNFQETLAAASRLYDIMDVEPEKDPLATIGVWHGIERGIEFSKVTFAYDPVNGAVLHEIDFEIPRGKTVALVGRSGSGKSTTADLLARFYRPDGGMILVDGVDLQTIDRRAWLEHVAVVSQAPFVFNTSVRENLRYGRPGATDDELVAAARAANIHDVVMALPQGYDTIVGDRGQSLSGGQLQRLTIARAIVRDADLLILDEATSALDTESERLFQGALENLAKGKTVLVIAHRLSTIRKADRIVVLDAGRVVEIGTHDELLAHGAHYSALHALQFNDPDAAPNAGDDDLSATH